MIARCVLSFGDVLEIVAMVAQYVGRPDIRCVAALHSMTPFLRSEIGWPPQTQNSPNGLGAMLLRKNTNSFAACCQKARWRDDPPQTRHWHCNHVRCVSGDPDYFDGWGCVMILCPTCFSPDVAPTPCKECDGRGIDGVTQHDCEECDGFGHLIRTLICERCGCEFPRSVSISK